MTYSYIRTVVIVVLVASISSCSFKSVYNQLDFIIPEYVEGIVTLDDVLEEKLEQRTQVLVHWHRNTQLLQYANWLRMMQAMANVRPTQQSIELQFSEAEKFWQILTVKLNNEMADLLPLLNKEQRKELYSHIRNKNKEYRDEFVDIDRKEQIENYTERLLDIYENWIGELTEKQELDIKKSAEKLHSTAELRLQRRLAWQSGIKKILETNESNQEKTAQLRIFLSGFESLHTEAMTGKVRLNKLILGNLTVQISSAMTEEQKDFFIGKTDKYIRMFTELAENR